MCEGYNECHASAELYLGHGENASAGGNGELLAQVVLLGPGSLQGQVWHEAIHGGVAHPQCLLDALLESTTHCHDLREEERRSEEE